jgi:signal peptidase
MNARAGLVRANPWWTRLVRAVSTALVVLVCALTAGLIGLAVLARSDDAGVSRVAGHPVLTVLSNSMTPTFRAGDLLIDRPATGPASQLAVGDVITFRAASGAGLITHRIVSIEAERATGVAYRTQGDANNAPDSELVSPDQVVGIYTRRIPYAGYALHAAHTQTGLFLLFAIPALLVLAPAFKTWWRASGDAGSPPGAPGPDAEAVTTTAVATGSHPGGGTHRAQ